MIKCKKIIVMLVFLFAFMTINGTVLAQSMTLDSESVLVDLVGNDISISGELKEVNKDVTIIVYRNSDNAKSYMDQGKTNENGEFTFQFSLPNGTYNAVVSCGSLKYTTSNIVVYKEPVGSEEEEINVLVNGDKVNLNGKINEKNKDVSIIVYRNSDNAKFYIDQGKTNQSGEYSFQFSLPNGTYKAVVSCGSTKYTTSNIVVYKEPVSIGEEEINVLVNGDEVNVNGKTNEKDNDISIVVYRNSDNSKFYIDQGKTNQSGEYSFQFSLPNGTYKAVVSCGSLKYTTSNIVVYKEPASSEEEEINVLINGENVNVNGKLNEKNKDISIIVYRNSDNVKSYIDQGKTNESGEYSFRFGLPNGTYKAVVSCNSVKYTISNIVVYKEPTSGEEGEVNIVVNGENINVIGKINEKNEDISITVYRSSDDSIYYINQGKTNVNGEFSFQFTLPDGTYKVVLNCGSFSYTSSNIVVNKELQIISATISPDKANFDKNTSNQQDVTTTITYNDAAQVTDVKNGSLSIGSYNYSVVGNVLKINKTYLALQETGNLVLTIDFIKGQSAKFTISITKTPSEGGSGGSGGSQKPVVPIPVTPENPIVNLSDITGHWAEDSIRKLITLGVISGYPDGTFKPDNNITRAEFVTILVKSFNLKSTSEDVFEDSRNHWAKYFINAGLSNGVIQGYSDMLFGPDELITREQMAVMAVNGMKLNLVEDEVGFNDKDQISKWAKKYVSTAVSEKLMIGYPDNTFRPKSNATRAEAVMVLLNALNTQGN